MYRNIIYIVFAVLGTFLAAIPFPKAITSGNVGTSMLILWTEVACVVQLANAIRWNGNIVDWAPFWCDFCGYFLIATDVALVGAAASINRRLYMIVTLDPRRHEKAHNAVVDFVLCLVVPMVAIALEYIVQQYRYCIYEDIGCVAGVGSVDLAFPLVWLIPLFGGTISSIYACISIRANLQRNRNASGANLVWSRRLISIGVICILYGLATTSAAIGLMASAYPVTSWPGWAALHSTIDQVIYVPAQDWQTGPTMIACLEFRRWVILSITYVIFFFLGLTEDVKKMYWKPFRSVVDHMRSGSDQSKCELTGFNHTSSFPPTCSGSATTEENTDECSKYHAEDPRSSHLFRNASESCTSFGKSPPESFCLTDRPRLESDLESV